MTRAALTVLALLAVCGSLAGQEHTEEPFPAGKSAILRKDRVRYIVKGKMTIPAGVSVSVQKNVYIVGKGEGATLRVEGTLKTHGVALREVIFEGVTVELGSELKEVHLDGAIFRNGGGVVTAPRERTVGRLIMLGVTFHTNAVLDVKFAKGLIDLASVTTSDVTRIVAEKRKGREKNKVRVNLLGCDFADLHMEKADEATVRLSRMAGSRASFHDCRALNFDGNKVNAAVLDIRSSAPGGLAKTKVTKCDVYSSSVAIRAPKKDGRATDQVVLDRCWFKGETDPKVVKKNIVEDAEDDEANGARVIILKPLKRPNELAGSIDR